MIDFKNKVVFVSGATGGIGHYIALEFARLNAMVIISYNKNYNEAKELKSKIKDLGGYATIVQCDIREYDSCDSAVKTILDKFGRIDILINNAGISVIDIFSFCKKEDITKVIGTNLIGTMNLTRCIIPSMINKKSGNIINISSMWGQVGASCEVLYSASKGGIDSFTKALGKELAPSNIRVNAISPGAIDTSMNAFLSLEDKKNLEDAIPMGRMGTPLEIAKLTTFLASDDSSYMTAQVIRLDGGFI